VIGTYNAGFDPDLSAMVDRLCAPSEGTVVAPPAGLTIKGLKTATCRVDQQDGWVLVYVVAQGGKWPPPNADGPPWINYELTLQTRPERFDADLARFRAVLRTFRLFKPEM
jgi:hypothetical protein